MTLILWTHLLSTSMMIAVIWFVQIVHYPLFRRVGQDAFVRYETEHTQRITFIVAPLMGIELVTAVLLTFLIADPKLLPWAWTGVALVAVCWLSTAFIQVPCHQKLSQAYDDATALWLINSNWIRTVAWTLRLPIAILLISKLS